jgi:SAM-dependent methyltransferase
MPKKSSKMIIRAGKWKPILECCREKRVLDIGCVGDYKQLEEIQNNIFFRLSHYSDIYGIDINVEGVQYLQSLGCKCHVLNALHLDELRANNYDVVLLGDIIEHMADPSSFLIKVRSCLQPEGIVICTTPNAFHYLNTLSILIHKRVTRRQHTTWFCSVTLKNIFRFSGFRLNEMIFINYWDTLLGKGARNPLRIIRYLIEKIVFTINPELCPTLMGIFSPDPTFTESCIDEIYKERWHP